MLQLVPLQLNALDRGMRFRRTVDERVGSLRITIEVSEGAALPHDCGIPDQSWRRGARFINHFGPDRALEVVDERAERAAGRGDYATAARWRTLITAIHAMTEGESLPGERQH